MNPRELVLKALPASEALQKFRAATAGLFSNTTAHYSVQSNAGSLSLQLQNGRMSDADESRLAAFVHWAAERRFVSCALIALQDASSQNKVVRYSSADALSATVEITGHTPDEMRDVVARLEDHFRFLSPHELVQSVDMGPGASSALQLRELSVADLKVQLHQLGDLLASITSTEVEARRTHVAEIDAMYLQKKQALEREHAERAAAWEAKRQDEEAAFAARQAAHAARVEQFETHEAKYMRRELLTKLNEFLDGFKSFKISKETDGKRRPIHVVVLLMCIPFLLLAVMGGWHYFQQPDYHFLVPLSSGIVGLSGTLLYYAKWNNRWFREHADAEMQSRNYKADMLRASWLAELASEWASDGKTPPTDLLEVFSRNLFQTGATTDVEHPVDAIFGLLRRAQRLDVAKDRVTIEAASKGAKE